MAGRAPRAPLYVATFTPASCQARVKPVCLGVKPVCLACVPGEEPAPRNWVPRSAAHTRLASCPRPRPASPPPAPPTLQPPHPAAHVAPVISRPELAPPPAPTGAAAGGRCAARAVSGAGQGGRPPLRSRGRAGVERQRCSGTHAAAPGQSTRALCVLPRPPTSHLPRTVLLATHTMLPRIGAPGHPRG